MPAATLLSGPMAPVAFGIWGTGVEIQVNPWDQSVFKTGGIQVRVALSCDVGVVCDPAAFCARSSVRITRRRRHARTGRGVEPPGG